MPLTVKLRSLHYLATPAAQQAIADAGQKVTDFLDLNAVGDWGEVCPTDAARNDQALLDGGRVVSQYTTHLDAQILIVTDAIDPEFGERDQTRILLPEEHTP